MHYWITSFQEDGSGKFNANSIDVHHDFELSSLYQSLSGPKLKYYYDKVSK